MSEEKKVKNLFLTGMPGLGKSTYLINKLAPYIDKARGYRTVRVRNEEGRCVGFAHVSPSYDGGVDCTGLEPEKMFLNVAEGRHFNKDIFMSFVVPELTGAVSDEGCFILMDEIGGKELSDEDICSVYRRALSSPHPCIGIIKHGMNAKHFDYDSYLKFMEELAGRGDTVIVEFKRDDTKAADEFFERWLQEAGFES